MEDPDRTTMIELLQEELFITKKGELLISLSRQGYYAQVESLALSFGGISCNVPHILTVYVEDMGDMEPVNLTEASDQAVTLLFKVTAWVHDLDEPEPPRKLRLVN